MPCCAATSGRGPNFWRRSTRRRNTATRIGCIEQAHQTTLLIDEIGDILPAVQIKLLRVLQQGANKTFQRLGGQSSITSNVRILAATNRNLRERVAIGAFREDLYYRLNTLVIQVPPLRHRLGDMATFAGAARGGGHVLFVVSHAYPRRRVWPWRLG